MAQIDLAGTSRVCLNIDFEQESLKLMLKGAVIWECRMDIDPADSLQVRDFKSKFRGRHDKLVRFLAGKHLYEAEDKTPDSILAIVGEAVKVDPRLLQRDMPERFLLNWSDNLAFDIYTDIKGSPVSVISNTIEEIRQRISSPFGKTAVVMKMDADDALTLYRTAEKGMLTMVWP